jgi:hypothetical protein
MPLALKPDISYGFTSFDLRGIEAPWPPEHSQPLSWEEYNRALRGTFPSLWLMILRLVEGLRGDGMSWAEGQ